QVLATDTAQQVLTITGISTTDAVEIITSKLTSVPDEDNVKNQLVPLVERLGHWPLAIELAGAELHRRVEQGDRINNAIEYLQQALDVQGVVAFDRPDLEGRRFSVAKTLEFTLNQLTEAERLCYTRLAEFGENEQIPLDQISGK